MTTMECSSLQAVGFNEGAAALDIFEAVKSRIACRHFLDKAVDPLTIRNLIERAARAASSGNLQPWNVYAVSGEPLRQITRQAIEAIEQKDLRAIETEYPEFPDKLWEPYISRKFEFGAQLYGSLGISLEDATGRFEQVRRNFQFFGAPVGVFITIDRRLGPGQWADLGGYVNALAVLARGYGLDTCPQVLWIRMHKIVGALLKFPPEQMLYCGVAIGFGDRSHPVNRFRTKRAELHDFCRFVGFERV
jgi:nitroreductase